MQRPANYSTRQSRAVLDYLEAEKNTFVSAAQITGYLRQHKVAVSRSTVYRQLERLERHGLIRKRLFDGSSVCCYQYMDAEPGVPDSFHMICESCEEVFSLDCEEVDQVSKHVLDEHQFLIDEGKTVFYGQCKTCMVR